MFWTFLFLIASAAADSPPPVAHNQTFNASSNGSAPRTGSVASPKQMTILEDTNFQYNMFPKLENFQPPEGYQPVRGYEPITTRAPVTTRRPNYFNNQNNPGGGEYIVEYNKKLYVNPLPLPEEINTVSYQPPIGSHNSQTSLHKAQPQPVPPAMAQQLPVLTQAPLPAQPALPSSFESSFYSNNNNFNANNNFNGNSNNNPNGNNNFNVNYNSNHNNNWNSNDHKFPNVNPKPPNEARPSAPSGQPIYHSSQNNANKNVNTNYQSYQQQGVQNNQNNNHYNYPNYNNNNNNNYFQTQPSVRTPDSQANINRFQNNFNNNNQYQYQANNNNQKTFSTQAHVPANPVFNVNNNNNWQQHTNQPPNRVQNAPSKPANSPFLGLPNGDHFEGWRRTPAPLTTKAPVYSSSYWRDNQQTQPPSNNWNYNNNNKNPTNNNQYPQNVPVEAPANQWQNPVPVNNNNNFNYNNNNNNNYNNHQPGQSINQWVSNTNGNNNNYLANQPVGQWPVTNNNNNNNNNNNYNLPNNPPSSTQWSWTNVHNNPNNFQPVVTTNTNNNNNNIQWNQNNNNNANINYQQPANLAPAPTHWAPPVTTAPTTVASAGPATIDYKALFENSYRKNTPQPPPPVNPENLQPSNKVIHIDDQCMKCLCFIESWCSDVGCVWDQGSLSCGWYQLKYEYWVDCGQPGGGWKECSNNKKCAEGCVRQYMTRYGGFCSVGNSCADLARIHNGGPYGCGTNTTEYYGWLIARCLKRESPYEKIDTFPIPT